MDVVLAYWQGLGVDGFRCDFAHWVPVEFWKWAIARARSRAPAYFFAEAYDNPDAAPGFSPSAFVQAGFDALYDYQLYNGVKGIFASGKWCNDLDALLPDAAVEGHLLRYAENHDECRAAAPIKLGDPGNSGFGSAWEGFAVTALLHALGPDPALLYNGQEVGEPGQGAEGFGGDDGRTTIFDYWTMPAFARWVNGHAYDGANLTGDQQSLRSSYLVLWKLLSQPAFAEGKVYSIQSANKAAPSYGGSGQWMYGFLRYQPDAGQTYLVLINLDPANGYQPKVHLPTEALNQARLPPSGATLHFADAFSPYTASAAASDLPTLGVEIDMPPLGVRMLRITSG
jgi:glycosidase